MGIRRTTPISAIENYLNAIPRIIGEEIRQSLAYLGEESINKARDRSSEESWIDHSGNLRSSVGYAIYEYGHKTIESAFRQVLNGSEGASEGRKMVEELAKQYSDTYALVVVAAMNYADYVEALENKDVLASTELWARGVVDSYIVKAKERAIKRINALKI